MEHAAEGIVLSSLPYEESFIVDVFTKEYGRVKFVAKKQKKLIALSPLLAVELVLIPSLKSFWKCKEVLVRTSFPKLRTARTLLEQAAFAVKLLTSTLPVGEPHEACFLYFREFLDMLPLYRYPETATCVFLSKFCHLEGLFPGSELESHEKELCVKFIESSFEMNKEIGAAKSVLKKLEKLAKGGT
jgi:DNA repair protein RecO